MATRQPLTLSLAGFQFTHRSSYFDWRLLHGIDIDNVIRLTDVQAVEDCLDTLQRGSFGAERDGLLPSNCVQLFRLLQLAIEYCAHLRAAHALLLKCYNTATAAAVSWRTAARAYLDAGAVFVAESLAVGALNRQALDATDMAKQALDGADRDYNTALDALETEDTRARHFRFRKHRTEISWSKLHATDVDRLVSSLDVTALEALLPNLTYGSITAEDDQQLTPHHFAQLVPLAQTALDYVLWQANATGALLEQAMTGLQAACSDIPMITSATQDMHTNIASLVLGSQQTGSTAWGTAPGANTPQQYFAMAAGGASPGGAGAPASAVGPGGYVDMGAYGGGGGSMGLMTTANGSPAPWATGSVDLGQPYAQVLRLGSGGPGTSRLGGAPGTGGPTAFGSRGMSGSLASGNLDEIMLAAGGGGGVAPGTAAFPVLELHNRTAELSHKVESIEQDLRLERSKTEEMRRILADIRDRLNQRPGLTAGSAGASASLGNLSPAGSLTFPAAAATLGSGMGPSPVGVQGYAGPAGLTSASAFINAPAAASAAGGMGPGGGGGAGLRGSAAGVNVGNPGEMGGHTPVKVRVVVDEDAIREQERQRAVEVLTRQAERLTQQIFREHQERRQANAAAAMTASQQLAQLGGSAAGLSGLAARLQQQDVSSSGGGRHSRQPSRGEGRRVPRRSSPNKVSRPASSGSMHHLSHHSHQPSYDYSSDPDLAAVLAAGAGHGTDPRLPGSLKVSAGGSKPPKPFSRLSTPMAVHGSLGDLPSVAGGGVGYGGGLPSRFAAGQPAATASGAVPGGSGTGAAAAGRSNALFESAEG